MARADSNALTIGDYLVRFSQRHGDPITNLKLQKLLYYAEGWYLALHNRSLYGEAIRAWPRGPVVYSVWKAFSGYAWRDITKPVVPMPTVSKRIERHIAELMDAYGNLSAYALERMTHEEPPWKEAREGLPDGAYSNREISRESMRQYFSSLAGAS